MATHSSSENPMSKRRKLHAAMAAIEAAGGVPARYPWSPSWKASKAALMSPVAAAIMAPRARVSSRLSRGIDSSFFATAADHSTAPVAGKGCTA